MVLALEQGLRRVPCKGGGANFWTKIHLDQRIICLL